MISVGDKARIIKGHSVGYEDTVTRMFLATSGYDFVQCQRDEIEIIERTSDIQQYRIGDTVLYPCEKGAPPQECLVFQAHYATFGDTSKPTVMYYIHAGYADFRIVFPGELTPITYSLF